MEGCFTHHEHQLAPFLESHIGGAEQQVGGDAGGNGGHGLNGAGRYHHGIHGKRAARQATRDILNRIRTMDDFLKVRGVGPGFQKERFFSGPAEHQMSFDGGVAMEPFQQSHTIYGAAGAGNSYHDFQIWPLTSRAVLNSEQNRPFWLALEMRRRI